jgi:hypothetical protein
MADTTEFEFDTLSNTIDKPYDQEESDIDFDALAQAYDTSWGRSSTPNTNQFSVKFHMDGPNRLVVNFAVIVKFGTQRELIELKRQYEDESVRVVNANLGAVKKRYKDLSGSALKATELSSSDSLETIGVTFHSPCRTAYYRRKTVFEIA